MKKEIDQVKIDSANRISIVQEYYFSRKLKEIERMRSLGINVINLGIGNPDRPPSVNTINKLTEACNLPGNHGYQSYIGIPALREAFSSWYKKYYNVSLNPENEILPLIGSKEGIMHISMAFLNKGDEVLVEPGYPTYQAVSKLMEANVKTYNLNEDNNWFPDFKKLENEDLSRFKIMWVNYPNMPTGVNATKELFERLVEFGLKYNILICNDNPYSFILNEKPLSILSIEGANEIALELNSLSKSHNMAGWRMGMVAGNNEYIKCILRVKSNVDSGMFLPIQIAAIEALNNPKSWYNELNEIYKQRRLIVRKIFNILDCKYDENQVGLFIWAKISDKYASAEELSELILKNVNVFITPGFIFGTEGEKYLRISLSNKEELLVEAKERIEKYLNN